jgi:hypothetical protein
MKVFGLLTIALFSMLVLASIGVWFVAAYHWIAFIFGAWAIKPWGLSVPRWFANDFPPGLLSHRRKALKALVAFVVLLASGFVIGLIGHWISDWSSFFSSPN